MNEPFDVLSDADLRGCGSCAKISAAVYENLDAHNVRSIADEVDKLTVRKKHAEPTGSKLAKAPAFSWRTALRSAWLPSLGLFLVGYGIYVHDTLWTVLA